MKPSGARRLAHAAAVLLARPGSLACYSGLQGTPDRFGGQDGGGDGGGSPRTWHRSARLVAGKTSLASAALLLVTSGCYSGLHAQDEEHEDAAESDGEGGDDAPEPSDGDGDDGDEPPGGQPEPQCLDAPIEVGASTMLRLTKPEYRNTIRALLDIETEAPFAQDERVGPFSANVSAVSENGLDEYRLEAERLAATAVGDGLDLPCDPIDVGERECAREFVAHFGGQAFRRPLESDVVDRYMELYDLGAESSFDEGLRLILVAMLQSPNFLYRVETGRPVDGAEGLRELDGYEIASRMSYFLWRSMPDEELFAAAADGTLDTAAGIEEQGRRMLEDPKFTEAVGGFFVEWLQLEQLESLYKDPERFPEFDTQMRQSMRREVELFGADVASQPDADLASLLTASHTFLDESLAEIYGIPWPGGEGFERVELDGDVRSGLLTMPGLLAVMSHADEPSVVLRGKFVREQLLCQALPAPPPDAESNTEADRLEDSPCKACHTLMDPIGEGFARYDAVGRYHAVSGEGEPISEAGEVLDATDDVSGPFEGAAELGKRLGASDRVQQCMAGHWFTYAVLRSPGPDDQCSMLRVHDVLSESEGRLSELVVSLLTASAFRYRVVSDQQGDQ